MEETNEKVKKEILAALVRMNEGASGPTNYRELTISFDSIDTAQAGLYGKTACGWLFVELLYVSEELRGQGIGRALMERAELEAIDRGCHSSWLDTFSFQAPHFYNKLGYEVFGELLDYPEGHTRHFLKKSLLQ